MDNEEFLNEIKRLKGIFSLEEEKWRSIRSYLIEKEIQLFEAPQLFWTTLLYAHSHCESLFDLKRQDGASLSMFPAFTTTNEVNAFAVDLSDSYFIGFNQGLLKQIIFFASVAIDDKNAFPEFAVENAILNARLRADRLDIDIPSKELRSIQTRMGTKMLLDRMVHFVWLHEAAHARLGHCAFLKQKCSLTTFSESNSEVELHLARVDGGKASAFRHMMEYQADTTAFYGLLQDALIESKQSEILETYPKDILLKVALTAALLMIAIFETIEKRSRENSTSHPSAHDRLATFFFLVPFFLKESSYADEVERVDAAFRVAVQSINKIAGLSKQLRPLFESLDKVYQRDGEAEYRKYQEFEALYAHMEPLLYR